MVKPTKAIITETDKTKQTTTTFIQTKEGWLEQPRWLQMAYDGIFGDFTTEPDGRITFIGEKFPVATHKTNLMTGKVTRLNENGDEEDESGWMPTSKVELMEFINEKLS